MKCLIIAEAGVNHNGDMGLAKELIWEAASAGADIVKFQTFTANSLATKRASKAEYQKKNSNPNESQKQLLHKLELSHSDHRELIDECSKAKIRFFSTAFDIPNLLFLSKIMTHKLIKIPSGEITNLPYLKKAGSLQKEIILSTGMSNLSDIEAALDILEAAGTSREMVTILHCTTQYPAPIESVNLLAIRTIQEAFKTAVGYSDHTVGISIPIAAVAMGASVIEKHITLNRDMEGPDHRASLEPHIFREMVQGIREVEMAKGDGVKRPSSAEKENVVVARKSIVASQNIKKGQIFTEENITTKRPGNGISPMQWQYVIGQIAKRDFTADELIKL